LAARGGGSRPAPCRQPAYHASVKRGASAPPPGECSETLQSKNRAAGRHGAYGLEEALATRHAVRWAPLLTCDCAFFAHYERGEQQPRTGRGEGFEGAWSTAWAPLGETLLWPDSLTCRGRRRAALRSSGETCGELLRELDLGLWLRPSCLYRSHLPTRYERWAEVRTGRYPRKPLG
jgi:hypothetical protein